MSGVQSVENPKACGVGKADQCCIYLVCGGNGFECERFGSLRQTLIGKGMNAKRRPSDDLPYPECQLTEGR